MPLDFQRYINEHDDHSGCSDEEIGARLLRASHEFVNGTWTGFKDELSHSIDNPEQTLSKFGASAIVGVGLAAMQRRSGLLKLTAETATFAMTAAFFNDIAMNLDATSRSFVDSYNGNRNADFSHTGKFMFDTALMTTGGMTGILGYKGATNLSQHRYPGLNMELTIRNSPADLQSRKTPGSLTEWQSESKATPNAPADVVMPASLAQLEIPRIKLASGTLEHHLSIVDRTDPVAKLYERISPSVLKIGWQDGSNSGIGSAFVLDAGWLATAHHCVKPLATGNPNYHVWINGAQYDIFPVWKDLSADLALMRLNDASVKLPESLKLGWAADLLPSDNVAIFGYPGGSSKPVMSSGKLIDIYSRIDCPSFDPLTEPVHFPSARISTSALTWNGNSGGPLVREDGAVVGIITSGLPTEHKSFSSAVEHLHLILNRARNRDYGSGPVNETHTFGRVFGQPGERDFRVRIDSLKPGWLPDNLAESVQKPDS